MSPMLRVLPLLLAIGCATAPGGDAPAIATPETAEREGLCQIDLRCDGGVPDGLHTACMAYLTEADGTTRAFSGAVGLRALEATGKPSYDAELRSYSEVPVWTGASWRVVDGEPGDGWQEPGFDDSAWTTATAPLDATATHLRHVFDLHSRDELDTAKLSFGGVDGATVYLNGYEVADASAVDGWVEVDLDLALFNDYTNVLAIEVRHGATAAFDANPSTVGFDLWLEAAGETRPTALLGMGESASWVLDGLADDPTLVLDRLGADLYRSLGGAERYAPQARFCELDLDDAYQGVYALREALPAQVEGEDAVADALAAPGGVLSVVDVDSAVDWALVQELLMNEDAWTGDVRLWRDADGSMRFVPGDLSHGLGSVRCDVEGWNPRDSDLADAVATDPAFRAALAARWTELRAGELADEAVAALVTGYGATLAPALKANVDAWPGLDDGCATTPELTDLLVRRAAWMDANIGAY